MSFSAHVAQEQQTANGKLALIRFALCHRLGYNGGKS